MCITGSRVHPFSLVRVVDQVCGRVRWLRSPRRLWRRRRCPCCDPTVRDLLAELLFFKDGYGGGSQTAAPGVSAGDGSSASQWEDTIVFLRAAPQHRMVEDEAADPSVRRRGAG